MTHSHAGRDATRIQRRGPQKSERAQALCVAMGRAFILPSVPYPTGATFLHATTLTCAESAETSALTWARVNRASSVHQGEHGVIDPISVATRARLVLFLVSMP